MERVALNASIVAFADTVGLRRRANAQERARRNVNGLEGDYARLLAIDRLGARCEAAGKLYLNPIKWHAYRDVGIRGLPDLGDFTDVKGRPQHWHEMIVQCDDEDAFAFLLVRAHDHPIYTIVGWLWGHEAKGWPVKELEPKRPAHVCPANALRDPADLRTLIHPNGGEP